MRLELPEQRIIGPTGELVFPDDDQISRRFCMLLEGQCEGLGAVAAAAKYGISKPRYYQLLKRYQEHGAQALLSQKRGPKSNHVRTPEVVRQVIRHRFLDPDASAAVIAQKLRQADLPASTRSVERIIEEYGLQKKNSIATVLTLSRPCRSRPPSDAPWPSPATHSAWNVAYANSWPTRSRATFSACGCSPPNSSAWAPGTSSVAGSPDHKVSSRAWPCN